MWQVVGQSAGLANLTLELEYVSGADQGDDCMTNSTNSFGTVVANGSGVGRVQIDQSSITATGDYTSCPNDGTTGTNHKNFNISSL